MGEFVHFHLTFRGAVGKIDSVWCTLSQFLEIGKQRFIITGVYAGVCVLRRMAFDIA